MAELTKCWRRPGFNASLGLRRHATIEKQRPTAQMLMVGANEPLKKKLTTEYTLEGLRKNCSRSDETVDIRLRQHVATKGTTTSSGERNPAQSMSRFRPRRFGAASSIGCNRTIAEKMMAAGRVVALTATAEASRSPAMNIRGAVGRLATNTA